MKAALAIGSLIYCLTANAQNLLVVQSATIHDLYGNTIVSKILDSEKVKAMTVFNARQFTNDSSTYSRKNLDRVLEAYVKEHKPAIILFLGEPSIDVGVPTKYSPVLFGGETFNSVAVTAAAAYNSKWDPVYVVSDNSALAALRLVELRKQLKDVKIETYNVTTVLEYRQALQKLQGEPKGTLVLNAFTLVDEWNENVGYDEIEKLLVTANKRHLDVGICRTGFRTTLALGPTPAEAASIALSSYSQPFKSHISSCANLTRVKSRWLKVYRTSMGKFDTVEGG